MTTNLEYLGCTVREYVAEMLADALENGDAIRLLQSLHAEMLAGFRAGMEACDTPAEIIEAILKR